MDAYELEDVKNLNNRTSSDTRSSLEKGAYTGWQLFFLLRLEALLRQEDEYTSAEPGAEPAAERNMKIKLLHKAIYSTYGDCLDLKVGPAAKRMFKLRKKAAGQGALQNN